MVQLVVNVEIWIYCIISAGALFAFVNIIIICICNCRRNDNKSNTANRSLPDIPKDKNIECETDGELREIIYEVTENISGDPSELYATVQDKNKERKDKRDKQSISQQSSQDETASLYARLKTPQTSSEEHPYAQVQNVPKTESIQHPNTSHTIDLAMPSTSGALPIAPPRSRRSSSHNSLLEQPVIIDIPAATAITGGVQANQDLPYMTPPLLMHLPEPPQPQNNNQQQHFSGDSQDSKGYTSISVREPLANIIAQTKSAHHQRQVTRPIIDPHYATVSDDSDEMYAAIDEQDKVYTSGSETYAQIQPMAIEVNRPAQGEQASMHLQPSLRTEESYALVPQPPSVDSLRHVAHAHSRQASSSSATSSVANPGSPKPEKRQANSPLPPPPENPMDMYAMVDKRTKIDGNKGNTPTGKSLDDMYAKVMKKKREMNHEDIESSSTSINNSPNSIVFADTVLISRADGVISTARRKLSLIEMSRASWSSHDSVEILKREPDCSHHVIEQQQQLRINGEHYDDAFDIDNGYEAVAIMTDKRISDPCSDANYETLRPLPLNSVAAANMSGPINGLDTMPIYSMPFKYRQISNASSEDPGYERVLLRKRPASDCCMDIDIDSEPNYESMPHEPVEPNYASVAGCRLGAHDSDADPNYESVSNGDPNYESVKYMSLAQPSSSEPPYERLATYKGHHHDPDYERIDSTTVPVSGNSIETDDEQYIQV